MYLLLCIVLNKSDLTNKNENDSQLKNILGDFTTEIERVLNIAPEQWFNYYYFWDSQNEIN